MSTSKVAMVTVMVCWPLLLLSMFPVRAIAGGHAPAPPPAASPTRTATRSQILKQVDRTSASAVFFQFRNAPGHRKMMRIPRSEDDVKRWRDTTTASTDSKGSGTIYHGQRVLVGSSPPTCRGKCGSCSPCTPIHVSIGSPRGSLTQQEYYPEVWRCKCGNKLFMP